MRSAVSINQFPLLGLQFQRQKMIDRFIIDFYCKSLKLAIEVDDSSHDFKYDYDQKRTSILKTFGITILRFSNREVLSNPEGVNRNDKGLYKL